MPTPSVDSNYLLRTAVDRPTIEAEAENLAYQGDLSSAVSQANCALWRIVWNVWKTCPEGHRWNDEMEFCPACGGAAYGFAAEVSAFA